MARSSFRPVFSKVPWPKIVDTLESFAPAPTDENPPTLVMVWPSTSENSARRSLKPVVLTLAMLSPMTEIAVDVVSRPETLLWRALERDMLGTSCVAGAGGSRRATSVAVRGNAALGRRRNRARESGHGEDDHRLLAGALEMRPEVRPRAPAAGPPLGDPEAHGALVPLALRTSRTPSIGTTRSPRYRKGSRDERSAPVTRSTTSGVAGMPARSLLVATTSSW